MVSSSPAEEDTSNRLGGDPATWQPPANYNDNDNVNTCHSWTSCHECLTTPTCVWNTDQSCRPHCHMSHPAACLSHEEVTTIQQGLKDNDDDDNVALMACEVLDEQLHDTSATTTKPHNHTDIPHALPASDPDVCAALKGQCQECIQEGCVWNANGDGTCHTECTSTNCFKFNYFLFEQGEYKQGTVHEIPQESAESICKEIIPQVENQRATCAAQESCTDCHAVPNNQCMWLAIAEGLDGVPAAGICRTHSECFFAHADDCPAEIPHCPTEEGTKDLEILKQVCPHVHDCKKCLDEACVWNVQTESCHPDCRNNATDADAPYCLHMDVTTVTDLQCARVGLPTCSASDTCDSCIATVVSMGDNNDNNDNPVTCVWLDPPVTANLDDDEQAHLKGCHNPDDCPQEICTHAVTTCPVAEEEDTNTDAQDDDRADDDDANGGEPMDDFVSPTDDTTCAPKTSCSECLKDDLCFWIEKKSKCSLECDADEICVTSGDVEFEAHVCPGTPTTSSTPAPTPKPGGVVVPTLAPSPESSSSCNVVTCVYQNHPLLVLVSAALVLPLVMFWICRKCVRTAGGRPDPRGQYRAVAARLGSPSDNAFSDDYSADGDFDFDDEPEESWAKSGRRVLELSTRNGNGRKSSYDELDMAEING